MIRKFLCNLLADAEKVAENHRRNYADSVEIKLQADGNYLVTAYYS